MKKFTFFLVALFCAQLDVGFASDFPCESAPTIYWGKRIFSYSPIEKGHFRFEIPIVVARPEGTSTFEILIRYDRPSWQKFCKGIVYVVPSGRSEHFSMYHFQSIGGECIQQVRVRDPFQDDPQLFQHKWIIGMWDFPTAGALSARIEVREKCKND